MRSSPAESNLPLYFCLKPTYALQEIIKTVIESLRLKKGEGEQQILKMLKEQGIEMAPRTLKYNLKKIKEVGTELKETK